MKDHLEREQKFKDRMSINIKYILIWYKLMKLISEMREFSILAMHWLHFFFLYIQLTCYRWYFYFRFIFCFLIVLFLFVSLLCSSVDVDLKNGGRWRYSATRLRQWDWNGQGKNFFGLLTKRRFECFTIWHRLNVDQLQLSCE